MNARTFVWYFSKPCRCKNLSHRFVDAEASYFFCLFFHRYVNLKDTLLIVSLDISILFCGSFYMLDIVLLLLWRILNGRGLPNCLTELPSLKCLSSSLHSRDSHPFANVLRPSPSGSPSASPTLLDIVTMYKYSRPLTPRPTCE